MSDKRSQFRLNLNTYLSGGRAMGRSSSAVKGGLRSAFSSVNSSTKKNTSSKKSSSSSSSRSTNSYSNNRSSRSYTVSSSNRSSYSTSSRNNSNLGYNLKKYMGQRGGTFGDKSYTKIGDDYYLKANPYSGVDMNKNNKPKLLKENQYNISEENREKINKGRINNYIKGINPYSAPPKNIRDAKAKESVESLMNNIQKRKNEQVKKENSLLKVSRLKNQIDNLSKINNGPLNTKNIKVDTLGYGFNGNNTTNANKLILNNNINSIIKPMSNKSIQNKNLLSRKEISQNVNSYGFNQDDEKNILSNQNSNINERNKNNSIKIEKGKMKNTFPFLQSEYGFDEQAKNINTVYNNTNNIRKVNEALKNISDLTINNTNNIIKKQFDEVNKQKELEKQKNKKVANVGDFRQYIENIGKINKYPVYGSKMSVSDVNLLNKRYDGVITATEDEAEYYKKLLNEALGLKSISDFFKRKHYEKTHTTTSIPKTTSEQLINNRVDFGDFRNAVPDDIIGKNKIGINLNLPYISDKMKEKEVEKLENDFGKDKLEDNLNNFGGQDLPFETPLALSIYPEFRNLSLDDIENMSVDQRKMVYILAKAEGQKVSDKYARYLIPEQVEEKSKKVYNYLNDNKGISLFALGLLNEKNKALNGLKQTLNLIIGNDKTPVDDNALNIAINKIGEKGSKGEKILLDLLDTGHSSIEDAIMTYLTGIAGAKIYDGLKSLGESYSDRIHSVENDGSLKFAEKAQNEAVNDAIKDVALGHFMDKYSEKIIKNLKDYNINIPDWLVKKFINNKFLEKYYKNLLENIDSKDEKIN